MRVRETQLTGAAGPSWQTVLMEQDTGYIQTATITLRAIGAMTATIVAYIGITLERLPPEGQIAILADGILDLEHPIYWTGRIELGKGSRIFARSYIDAGTIINLSTSTRDA